MPLLVNIIRIYLRIEVKDLTSSRTYDSIFRIHDRILGYIRQTDNDIVLSLVSEFEGTQNKNKNGNWSKSLFSSIEVSSAISPLSNKLNKMDKEHLLNLEKKIDDITKGLNKEWSKNLRERLSLEDAEIICNYIISMRTEINPSDNYRRDSIKMPYLLSRYLKSKPFDEMTRKDIIGFLDSFRKPEVLDPLHKWIGTYNLYLVTYHQILQVVIPSRY